MIGLMVVEEEELGEADEDNGSRLCEKGEWWERW